jgi:hypothetical protein
MNEESIKKLVEKYPNDMELGSKVREMYWNQRDEQYRELLDLPSATTNNPKGTSVTSQIDTTIAYTTNPHPRTGF